MKTVCPECSNELHISDKVIMPTKIYEYQCSCFFVSNGVKVFHVDHDCPFCLTTKDDKRVFGCGHWICDGCFADYKSNKCPICSEISGEPELLKKNEHQIAVPEQFIPSFKKLYKRIYGFIDRFVFLDYSTHDKTIVLLEEYYKWLTILAEHGGDKTRRGYHGWIIRVWRSMKGDKHEEAVELSPGAIIDKVWHEHILDLEDYIYVCNKLAGKILYHYPERSFDSVQDSRLVRLQKTHFHYKQKYGEWDDLTNVYWNDHISLNTDAKGVVAIPEWDIVVESMATITRTYTINENTTVEELKTMIFNRTGTLQSEQRLTYAGRQMEDGLSLYHNYGVRKESTIHLWLKMRGC